MNQSLDQIDEKQLTERLLIIRPVVSLWSGRKRLKPEDMGLDTDLLPPEELATLGTLKIFDPEQLSVFNRLKQAAIRACAKVGFPFLDGHAIPLGEAKTVIQELNLIEAEFEAELVKMMSSYEPQFAAWADSYDDSKGWKSKLKAMQLPRDEVIRRMRFRVTMFQLSPKASNDDAELNKLLGNTINGMSEALFEDVAASARDYQKRVLDGRQQVSQKGLRPLKALRQKLLGIAFVDSMVIPLIRRIDNVLAAITQEGYLSQSDISLIQILVYTFSDVQRMKNYAADQLAKGDAPVVEAQTDLDLEDDDQVESEDAQPVQVGEPVLLQAPVETQAIPAESSSELQSQPEPNPVVQQLVKADRVLEIGDQPIAKIETPKVANTQSQMPASSKPISILSGLPRIGF